MKTYIMMFSIANLIAGGPIYNTNKIRVLEEEGWNVIVFPTDSGKIYMKPLEKYNNSACSFLNFSPYVFKNKTIDCFLNEMTSKIPKSSELIIETGTDFTALWGELLAKKIGARHIVMFLDEKNDRVNAYTAPFYEFKYRRNELYSISEKSLLHIFGPFFKIENPEKNVWNAWCSNVVADMDSDMKNNLPRTDFMIGSIGRLDKPFVDNIIKGVCSFAKNHQELNIGMCFFGGADKKTISKIELEFSEYANIDLYISGYIWPIPQDIFDIFDVFISGAGSANVSANMGITTIDMDVITNRPVGFIDNPTNYHCTQLQDKKNSLETYLTAVLLNQNIPEICDQMTVENKWKTICADFKQQISQIESIETSLNYFDTSNVFDHKRFRRLQFVLVHLLGYKQFLLIRKIYNKLRKIE